MILPFSGRYQKRQFWHSSLIYGTFGALWLVVLYYGSRGHKAGSLVSQAFCDRLAVATTACELPESSSNATNATDKAAPVENGFSIEKLVANSTLGVYPQSPKLIDGDDLTVR